MEIEKIKRKLLIKYPLFGSVISNAQFKEIDCHGLIACTDGHNIYYNPKMMDSLSEEEQKFVIAHEVCHMAFDHILRLKNKDKELWNIATDAVINSLLKQDGLKFVEGGVDVEKAKFYDAETLYNELVERKKNKKNDAMRKKSFSSNSNSSVFKQASNLNGESRNSNNSNLNGETPEKFSEKNNDKRFTEQEIQDLEEKGDNIHNHNLWEEALKEEKENSHKKENSQSTKKNNKVNEKDVFKKNKEERAKQIKELIEEMSKESGSSSGNSTDSKQIKIDNIEKCVSVVPWQKILFQSVMQNVDWTQRNAVIEDGVLVSKLEELEKPDTEILLDTSGSVSKKMLKNFLYECYELLGFSNLKIGCFDTKFYGYQIVKAKTDIENLQIKGGGGTNFQCAVEALTRNEGNKIIFTDGKASVPKNSEKAIWIIYGDEPFEVNKAKIIRIDSDALKKLMLNRNQEIIKNK